MREKERGKEENVLNTVAMQDIDTSSRSVALDILRAVVRKEQPFDEALAQHKGFAKLEKRDRAFVHALDAMILRRLGQIDDAIKGCLDKTHDLKAPVHDILRLGAGQILFLQTPAHAAVDTTVSLAGAQSQTAPFKGLINAVMRRLAREGQDVVAKQDAARLNTPDWLWLAWRKAYGTAHAREIAQAHLSEAPVDLTVRENPAEWAEKIGGRLLPSGSIRLTSGEALQSLPGFAEGAWWVQDAAAALPALLLGDVAGQHVFDLCAAPGGKAMQLAARGARVVAIDRSAARLGRLRENLKRTGLDMEIITTDATTFSPQEKADALLLDAPCSATGTIRRHPDVWRLKKPEDVARMAALQEKLLVHAATQLLKPGGRLVYAVCSLQKEEAEDQVARFLEAHADFIRDPIRKEEVVGFEEALTDQGDLRLLPFHGKANGGVDGFFVARLMRHT